MKKMNIIAMFTISMLLLTGCGENLAGQAYLNMNDTTGNVIIPTGNLGIGDNDPETKISIKGNVRDTGITLNNIADGVKFKISSRGTWAGFGVNSPGVAGRFYVDNDINRGIIIKSGTGNVGINNPNPSEALDVNGNIIANNICNRNGTCVGDSQGGSSSVWNDNGNIWTMDTIGINTSNPTATLEVNGNIKSNSLDTELWGMRSTVTPWKIDMEDSNKLVELKADSINFIENSNSTVKINKNGVQMMDRTTNQMVTCFPSNLTWTCE